MSDPILLKKPVVIGSRVLTALSPNDPSVQFLQGNGTPLPKAPITDPSIIASVRITDSLGHETALSRDQFGTSPSPTSYIGKIQTTLETHTPSHLQYYQQHPQSPSLVPQAFVNTRQLTSEQAPDPSRTVAAEIQRVQARFGPELTRRLAENPSKDKNQVVDETAAHFRDNHPLAQGVLNHRALKEIKTSLQTSPPDPKAAAANFSAQLDQELDSFSYQKDPTTPHERVALPVFDTAAEKAEFKKALDVNLTNNPDVPAAEIVKQQLWLWIRDKAAGKYDPDDLVQIHEATLEFSSNLAASAQEHQIANQSANPHHTKSFAAADPIAALGLNHSPLSKSSGFISQIGISRSFQKATQIDASAKEFLSRDVLSLKMQGVSSADLKQMLRGIQNTPLFTVSPDHSEILRLQSLISRFEKAEAFFKANPKALSRITLWQSRLNNLKQLPGRLLDPKGFRFSLARFKNGASGWLYEMDRKYNPLNFVGNNVHKLVEWSDNINPFVLGNRAWTKTKRKVGAFLGNQVLKAAASIGASRFGKSLAGKLVFNLLTKLGVGLAGGFATGGLSTILMALSFAKDIWNFLKENLRKILPFVGASIAWMLNLILGFFKALGSAAAFIGAGAAFGAVIGGVFGAGIGAAVGFGAYLIAANWAAIQAALTTAFTSLSASLATAIAAISKGVVVTAATSVGIGGGALAVNQIHYNTVIAEINTLPVTTVNLAGVAMAGACWPTSGTVTALPEGYDDNGNQIPEPEDADGIPSSPHGTTCGRAVDIGNDVGTPVYALFDGQIEYAGDCGGSSHGSGYGICVVIDTDNGLKLIYGHLAAIQAGVVSGGRVNRGQAVGAMDDTGTSTGNHLHFEVCGPIDVRQTVPEPNFRYGYQIDPAQLCNQSLPELQITPSPSP